MIGYPIDLRELVFTGEEKKIRLTYAAPPELGRKVPDLRESLLLASRVALRRVRTKNVYPA